jgi:hypothetical protein
VRATFARLSLVLLLALVSCNSLTLVYVTVSPGSMAPTGVTTLDLSLTLGGMMASHSYHDAGGSVITLPTTLVLQIGSGSGTLAATVIARNAAGTALAQGSNSVTVVRGKRVDMSIVFGSNGGGDMGGVPSVPQNFMATADIARGATLGWAAPASDGGSAITGYSITATPVIPQVDVAATTLQTQVTALTTGATYTFSIVANNAFGSGPPATAMATIVDVPAPVVTACRYNNQNRVFWPPIAGASGYNVYFATAPGVTKASTQAGSMVMSPYAHTSLNNGTAYYYRVSAIVSGVEGALSNEVSATPQSFVVPTNVVYGVNHVLNNQGAVYIWDNWLNVPGNNPSRIITGPNNSNLSAPIVGIFVDREAGLIYVGNGELNNTSPPSRRVNVYAGNANGDVAPLRVLQDGDLHRVRGVAVDTTRNILYVVNQDPTPPGASEVISIDDACHFAGSPTARAHITAASQIYWPTQIVINEATDELYVANYNNTLVYKNVSQLKGTPSVAPSRVIAINGVTQNNQGVALDTTHDVLYIEEDGYSMPPGAIFSLDNASTVNGTVAPTRTIKMVPSFKNPLGIFVAAGTLLVGTDVAGPNYITSWANAQTVNGAPPPGATLTPSTAYSQFFTGVFYVP